MMPARRLRASLSLLCLAASFTAAHAADPPAPAPAAQAPAAAPAPGPATSPATGEPAAAIADPELAAAVEAGRGLYLKNCRTCHGSKGTAGVPLAGNPKVSADPGYLIWAIMTGPGYMPEFGPVLSDEDIAGIATFIMNSWGNDYGPVTAEDVHGLR